MSTGQTRTAINQANAQHSTGPKTPQGKQRSSMNALTHGLTSNSVVLPFDSLDDYSRHVQSYFDACQPEGPLESDLVQSLADTAWRLNRINRLEENFMFLPLDIQAKSIASMSMHSQRLSRQFERTEKHLRELQKIRRDREQEQPEHIEVAEGKRETHRAPEPRFVFSNQEIDAPARLLDDAGSSLRSRTSSVNRR